MFFSFSDSCRLEPVGAQASKYYITKDSFETLEEQDIISEVVSVKTSNDCLDKRKVSSAILR